MLLIEVVEEELAHLAVVSEMGRERVVHVDVLVAHCGERRAQAVRACLGEANAKDL